MSIATDESLRQAIAAELGEPIVRLERVRGGDINRSFKAYRTRQPPLFIKTNAQPRPGMFRAEAEGLLWLTEAAAVQIPSVLAVCEGQSATSTIPFLALEYVEPGPRPAGFDAQLGVQLARLHQAGAKGFGHLRDNFIGTLPQSNRPTEEGTWASFYRQRRLEPQIQLAVDAGLVGATLRETLDTLLLRLDDLVGPPEPPARLHGDLWAGNHMASADGRPVLFDPAAYGGHREMDLAMMRLFGGYSDHVFGAYSEAFPLQAGHHQRVALYQLYPLLVHVNLFAGGYVAQLEAAVKAALGA